MSRCQRVARPVVHCLRRCVPVQPATPSIPVAITRLFQSSASHRHVEPPTPTTTTTTTATTMTTAMTTKTSSTTDPLPTRPADSPATTASTGDLGSTKTLKEQLMDPNTTTLYWAERKLLKKGVEPIGSRRRRAAVRQSPNLPFEQLPYHCFQEARKLLAADRLEKLKEIRATSETINKLEANPKTASGNTRTLGSLRKHLLYLKIQADVNDPGVRRKFEDGLSDLTKPIYRHFAEQKWRGMAYEILAQRLSQFHIVPDVLPQFDPRMDVQISFRGYSVQPGEIVDSLMSEIPPNLRVQVFDGAERLVSVVVMDSDVPNLETDSFDRRLHFMAANIPINCLTKNISLNVVSRNEAQLAVPWLPPTSQEGAPYRRLSVWLLEQTRRKNLNVVGLKQYYSERNDFHLPSFAKKFKLEPFGFNIFRTVWDEGTATVMQRHGIPGADVIFRPKKVVSLRPPKKARGWEAKRQGPKYRFLWKYTKRIAPMSGGR